MSSDRTAKRIADMRASHGINEDQASSAASEDPFEERIRLAEMKVSASKTTKTTKVCLQQRSGRCISAP